jgi:threonine 3-dehydrogenase
MKALGKQQAARGMTMFDAPIPKAGPNDLLIKVKKTAVCGTDLHIHNWDEWAARTIKVPMINGHEFVGVVAEVGSAVEGFHVGQRVSGEGHITCGHCRNCRAGKRHLCPKTVGLGVHRDGCFAEYVTLPAFNAFPIADEIPDEIACFFDPYGNAVHSALSFDLVGEDVLITGAGPVGLLSTAVARHVGARYIVVSDVNDYRLELARKLGAHYTVNPTKESLEHCMQKLGMREGFDIGLEMSGHPAAFSELLRAMNNGGKVALLGLLPKGAGINWDDVIFKGLILKGIYGREMFETWYKMSSMLQSGLDISPVLTHEFKADDFQQAFDVMNSGQCGKVILDWA